MPINSEAKAIGSVQGVGVFTIWRLNNTSYFKCLKLLSPFQV